MKRVTNAQLFLLLLYGLATAIFAFFYHQHPGSVLFAFGLYVAGAFLTIGIAVTINPDPLRVAAPMTRVYTVMAYALVVYAFLIYRSFGWAVLLFYALGMAIYMLKLVD
jgi:hypothetical protein